MLKLELVIPLLPAGSWLLCKKVSRRLPKPAAWGSSVISVWTRHVVGVWFHHKLAPPWALTVLPCVGLGSEPHLLRRLIQSPTGPGASSHLHVAHPLLLILSKLTPYYSQNEIVKDPQGRPKFLDSGSSLSSPGSYWPPGIPCLA